jgi:ribose transport system substrate-binding protein
MKFKIADKKIWFWAIGANFIFLMTGILFFSGKIDFSAGNQENRIKAGVCLMTMDNSYFEMIGNAIGSVIEEHGDILIARNPNMDKDKQNEQINDLISRDVKAIFIAPISWESIESSVKKAREKGIKIIVVDSQAYDDSLVDCTVTSDNYGAGIQIANYLKTQAASAKIALLKQSGIKSSEDRANGFKKALDGISGFEIAGEKEYGGDAKSALLATEELIRSGVNFDAIFATNDAGAFGAYGAIEKSAYLSAVSIMGVDGSPDGKNMVKNKQMIATVAQFPTDIGKKAAENMYLMLDGKKCEKEIYIPVKLITKYTIDSYDIEKWQ